MGVSAELRVAAAEARPVYTIGHSNHPIERFIGLLQQHGVTCVADVRTIPASRFQPQFSRGAFARALEARGIAYLFFGAELGGRPRDPARDYERMAREPAFAAALRRVCEEAARRAIALVCAERDPLDCHRALLVGRALAEKGVELRHIHFDGALETQAAFEARLLKAAGLADEDLLEPRAARLARAYRLRAQTPRRA